MELPGIESDKCVVCMEYMLDADHSVDHLDHRPVILCSEGHSACDNCRVGLVRGRMKCPICRSSLNKKKIRNIVLGNLIQEVRGKELAEAVRVNQAAMSVKLVEKGGAAPRVAQGSYIRSDVPVVDDSSGEGFSPYGFPETDIPLGTLNEGIARMLRPSEYAVLRDSAVGMLLRSSSDRFGYYFLRCITAGRRVNADPHKRARVFLTDEGLSLWMPKGLEKIGCLIGVHMSSMFGSEGKISVFPRATLQIMRHEHMGCVQISSPRTIIQILLAFGMGSHSLVGLIAEGVERRTLKTKSKMFSELSCIGTTLAWESSSMRHYREELVAALVAKKTLPPFPLKKDGERIP